MLNGGRRLTSFVAVTVLLRAGGIDLGVAIPSKESVTQERLSGAQDYARDMGVLGAMDSLKGRVDHEDCGTVPRGDVLLGGLNGKGHISRFWRRVKFNHGNCRTVPWEDVLLTGLDGKGHDRDPGVDQNPTIITLLIKY